MLRMYNIPAVKTSILSVELLTMIDPALEEAMEKNARECSDLKEKYASLFQLLCVLFPPYTPRLCGLVPHEPILVLPKTSWFASQPPPRSPRLIARIAHPFFPHRRVSKSAAA